MCCKLRLFILIFFFFNDTATTEIYTLSLHDALPIYGFYYDFEFPEGVTISDADFPEIEKKMAEHVSADEVFEREDVSVDARSEEHTSELQSRQYLVCRLLLEKKKKKA